MPDTLPIYLDPIFTACFDEHRPLLAVAVSGGSDSMALALLLHAWCEAHRGKLIALSVDHGLRAESARECADVAAWMGARGIAHRTLTLDGLAPGGNLQARAREARYDALVAACKKERVEALCVAHHAEDQAETVLLQRHRGSGTPSRSGMPLVAWRGGVQVVRPLLGVRKSLLRAYLLRHDQRWIEDPSNASDHYARNRLRRTMSEDDIKRLWYEAQAMGEQRHFEDRHRNTWLASYGAVTLNGTITLFADAWRMLDVTERKDILSRAIQIQGGKRYRPRHHETVRLDRRIMEQPGGKATLGHTVILWSPGEAIRITPEPHAAASRSTGLDERQNLPHMALTEPPKTLEAEPFWWFNSAPYF